MATVQQCRQALTNLAGKLASDHDAAARAGFDRSLQCHIRDLRTDFRGRFRGGTIVDLTDGANPAAQIRISVGSDDLVALVDGQLSFAGAWASGRLSVSASFGDLLKMRKLL